MWKRPIIRDQKENIGLFLSKSCGEKSKINKEDKEQTCHCSFNLFSQFIQFQLLTEIETRFQDDLPISELPSRLFIVNAILIEDQKS